MKEVCLQASGLLILGRGNIYASYALHVRFSPGVAYRVSTILQHAIFRDDIFRGLFHVLRHFCSQPRQLVQQDYPFPPFLRLVAERKRMRDVSRDKDHEVLPMMTDEVLMA